MLRGVGCKQKDRTNGIQRGGFNEHGRYGPIVPAVTVSENFTSLTPVVQHADDDEDGEDDVESEGDAEEGETEGDGFLTEEAHR